MRDSSVTKNTPSEGRGIFENGEVKAEILDVIFGSVNPQGKLPFELHPRTIPSNHFTHLVLDSLTDQLAYITMIHRLRS